MSYKTSIAKDRNVSFIARRGSTWKSTAIPRTAWEEKTLPQVRDYLVKGLKKTFATLKARLVKVDKEADLPGPWDSGLRVSCLRQFEEGRRKTRITAEYTSVQARCLAAADSQIVISQ